MSQQPVVPVELASYAPINLSPLKGHRDLGQALVSPINDFNEGSSRPTFNPSCNLHNESRLSACANALEFARHAFPPAAAADMEAMGSPALSHNMTYVAVQSMFYLV